MLSLSLACFGPHTRRVLPPASQPILSKNWKDVYRHNTQHHLKIKICNTDR